MKKFTKRDLNQYLDGMSSIELKKEINKLYTKFKDVQKYYELELSGDTSAVLAEYKNKIKKEYFPSRGLPRASSSECRKIISAFKKISIFQSDVVDLILYRVEVMVKFTGVYGDIDEPFYNSLETSFNEACKLIKQEYLETEFLHRCKEFIEATSSFGWGLHDGLTYIYNSYFSE